MRITSVRVSGYRNLVPQEISFPNRISVITGNNGQGKTNLIEAIYLLSQIKSFRTAKIRETVAWGSGIHSVSESEVSAEVEVDGLHKTLGFQISKEGKRKAFINGNHVQNARDFYGQLRVVEFTPSDLNIIQGAPVFRRSFIDRTLSMCDGAYVQSIVVYHRALKQRNALLQTAKREGSTGDIQALRKQLRPWEEILIREQRQIVQARVSFLGSIQSRLQIAHHFLVENSLGARDDAREIEIRYDASAPLVDGAFQEQQAEAMYHSTLERDIRYGSTSRGIHHDEISIRFKTDQGGWKSTRGFASQGQSRTIVLALKFSAFTHVLETTGTPPVVLLDDVESELDPSRREALFEFLRLMEAQTFITSTEPPDFLSSLEQNIAIFKVENGRIAPLDHA